MQALITAWNGLDMRRRVVVVLAIVAVVATMATMVRMASAPSMALLFAGLEAGAAGDVVQALEQRGAAYEVRGGSILVDAAMRDELRMTLASEGLPVNGGQGYELLDTLNGFGTTSQMFDAAYWRAKEGELARTIVSSPFASQARVHIANVSSNPFARSAKPTASVAITTTGGELTAAQAKAVRHLVASAVTGLSAEDVAVIDSNGALIGGSDELPASPLGDDKASVLRDRVQRIVEARVGRGNAVVEVSVDTVTETESIRERLFDPESRVAISTDVEERANTSSEQAAGVTVASDLPDGDAGEGEGNSAQNSETRERINYEISQTEREVIRAPGAIKRLTVAVLVNNMAQPDDSGAVTIVERPAEELSALRELVASAVGFDESRGDLITIKSMEMPSIGTEGTTADGSLLSGMALDIMSLIQMAVLALVTLILALFVVRPILMRPSQATTSTGGDFAALPGPSPAPALTGEIADDEGFPMMPMTAFSADPMGGADFGGMPQSEDPVDRLRNLINERKEETVEILRSWLEEEERA